jgi:17beta-estradiol 17-dehydrogenase / very-long-chain 3-oxoacyl-CoA reductase
MSFVELLVKFVIIYFAFKFAYFFYKNFIRQRLALSRRYGKNSWVLVTGATEGIGKGFCEEFAKEGFNIILVSRNIEKLKNTSD